MSNQNNDFTEQELTEFFYDTSALVAAEQTKKLEKAASGIISVPAAQMADTLVDRVEFQKLVNHHIPNDERIYFEDYKYHNYTIGNISTLLGKTYAIGAAVGAGIEALTQYKRYKNGELSGIEYLKSIATAGGHVGTTAAVTAGIMIPVQAAIKAAGVGLFNAVPLITIPIGFAVSMGVDKIVAPLFKRGDYAVQLASAKFYSDMNIFYADLVKEAEKSGEAYRHFIISMVHQQLTFNKLNDENKRLSEDDERLSAELEKVLKSI